MTEQERQRLRQALQTIEQDPELEAEEAETLEPLDPVVEERIVAVILKELAAGQAGEGKEEGARIIPIPLAPQRRVHRRPWKATALALAVAAAAAVVIGLFPESLHPVPPYRPEVQRDDMTMAQPAESDGVARLSRDSTLSVKLRPQQKVHGAVEALVFLSRGGHVEPWDVKLEASPGGAFLLRGSVRDLPQIGQAGQAGQARERWELLFVIGHHKDLPSSQEVERSARQGGAGDHGWRLIKVPVEINTP